MPEKSEGTVLWTSCSFLLHLSVSLLLLLCVLCHARQRQTIFNADSALTYLCWLYIVRMIIITRTDSYGIESPWPLALHPLHHYFKWSKMRSSPFCKGHDINTTTVLLFVYRLAQLFPINQNHHHNYWSWLLPRPPPVDSAWKNKQLIRNLIDRECPHHHNIFCV